MLRDAARRSSPSRRWTRSSARRWAAPSRAVFRTADIVGLDTFVHVAKNCYDTLTQDEERDDFKPPAFIEQMVEKGMLGDKTGGGFYKKAKGARGREGDPRARPARRSSTGRRRRSASTRWARPRTSTTCASASRTVLTGTDKAAKFAERVTLDVLAYASRRIPEIADDIVNIDRGMRWGFGWDLGPSRPGTRSA